MIVNKMTFTIYDLTLQEVLDLPEMEFNPVEEAARLCFLRAQRFIEGFYVENEITEFYHKFFGNTGRNQKFGLVNLYKNMKQDIIKQKKIGLILIGANLDNILIDQYPTVNNTIIDLTVKSISRVLLREHFTREEIDRLCRETPNFNIYYKTDNQ